MFPKLTRQAVRQSVNGRTISPSSRNPSAAPTRPKSLVAQLFSKVRGGKFAAVLGTLLVASTVSALPPGTEEEIRTRLVAAGQLCRAGDDCGGGAAAAASAGPRSGEEVYNQFCFACHATGVGGAPMVGDAAAWEPRIAKGMDALWGTMQNGLNAMPPMGTCMTCSEDELRASMNFLVDSAK